MKRPIESDYASHVAYSRALEEYCDSLEKQAQLKRGPIGFDQTRLISQLSNMYLVGHHDGKKLAQREWIGLTPKNTVDENEIWKGIKAHVSEQMNATRSQG